MPMPLSRTCTFARRRLRPLIAGALAISLAAAGITTAGVSAASTTPGSDVVPVSVVPQTPEEKAASTAGKATGDTYDVTLVTGDTVHVTVGADGKKTATVSQPDGSQSAIWIRRRGGDLYVVPQDIASLIPRRLDPALFDVTTLRDQGYTETQSNSLPLIVTYQPGARLRSKAAPSTGRVRQLESVHGIGLHADKGDAARIGTALDRLADRPRARTLRAGPLAGIKKIWLDRQTKAVLDESVPQIGAPTAWDRGYDGSGVTVAVLDTGIDTDHPDLAGKVVAAKNFSNSDTVDDHFGHGTHVASTIGGSGAASDGKYKGVAPGVDLMNVKVLGDSGSGTTSEMIDGMEWAAQHDADVVNLSLGVRGSYTDGTDPGSQAVNALTEQYGTLFVIAAGNDGPNASTITTPGTADKALTVGAVDKQDELAGFSSRGPRAGDRALKPDITAPGVHITAARAGGTALCQVGCVQPEDGPVNEYYTSASGTSMATPHVAGAAALMADARPDLDAMQLKELLMGTASPNEHLG
ncbi:MAG: S8 family serine peptidase, partial [Nocardioidaceae bacterium]